MARIKCGNCKGTHTSTDEVRACYRTPAVAMITDRQMSYLTDLLASRKAPEDWAENITPDILSTFDKTVASTMITTLLKQPVRRVGTMIPGDIQDGRYAYMGPDGKPRFYRIATREDTDGSKYRIVLKVLGAPGDFRYVNVTRSEAQVFIDAIKDDPGYACQLFGFVVGVCGVCGSPLTDPESIALGIGPVCATKSNW